jgi:hypothetical protein
VASATKRTNRGGWRGRSSPVQRRGNSSMRPRPGPASASARDVLEGQLCARIGRRLHRHVAEEAVAQPAPGSRSTAWLCSMRRCAPDVPRRRGAPLRACFAPLTGTCRSARRARPASSAPRHHPAIFGQRIGRGFIEQAGSDTDAEKSLNWRVVSARAVRFRPQKRSRQRLQRGAK